MTTSSAADPVSQAAYPRQHITAGILAGGRGMRMGGRDKGLLPLAGQPMVAHVIAALQPQAGHILINANRNLDRYARFNVPLVRDRKAGFAGPLAGMDALLAASTGDWLLVVPCDAPLLAPDLGPRLWQRALVAGAAAAVAAIDGQLEPVFVLLHRSLHARLQNDLVAGVRRTGAWLRAQGVVPVDFSASAACFANVNTPAGRQALAQRWAAGMG